MGVVTSFNRRRKSTIVSEVAGVIRQAFIEGEIASLWGLEGTLRASLRADLCLRGWRWEIADQTAKDIVAGAHTVIGAKRPSWYEGQPDYAVSEGLLIERTRCANCHKALPEDRKKFCSHLCYDAHHHRLSRRRAVTDGKGAELAIRAL